MKRFNSVDTHATTEHPGSESDDEEPIMIQRRVPASLERQQNIAAGFTKDTSAKDVTEKQGYLHKQGGHVKVCCFLGLSLTAGLSPTKLSSFFTLCRAGSEGTSSSGTDSSITTRTRKGLRRVSSLAASA